MYYCTKGSAEESFQGRTLCQSFLGRMGVSPNFLKSPKTGGLRGLIEIIWR